MSNWIEFHTEHTHNVEYLLIILIPNWIYGSNTDTRGDLPNLLISRERSTSNLKFSKESLQLCPIVSNDSPLYNITILFSELIFSSFLTNPIILFRWPKTSIPFFHRELWKPIATWNGVAHLDLLRYSNLDDGIPREFQLWLASLHHNLLWLRYPAISICYFLYRKQ